HGERQFDPAGPHLRHCLPFGRRRYQPVAAGKPQHRSGLPEGVRQACATRQRVAAADQFAAHRQQRGKLLRRSGVSHLAVMILVTGGTGFIGTHLVDRLLEKKQVFRVLARRPGSVKNMIASRGDLATGEGVAEALEGVDTVIHLAGTTKTLTSEGYWLGNVVATENLARAIAAAARPIRVVHVSSLAAIGPAPDGAAVTEEDDPHPVSLYGESKLEGERRMRAHIPEAVVVRPPVVYGPRDTDVFEIVKSASRG